VQVKLWDPLRTRAIPERLRGVFTTRRYTNTRLPYFTLPPVHCLNVYTGAGRVQARPHGVQLSVQPSTPVPRRPLPVCIQCRLQTTSSLCQPGSSRCASLSSQQLRSAGFFCGRPCDMELVTRQSEKPGHQQRLLQTFTEDVFKTNCYPVTHHT